MVLNLLPRKEFELITDSNEIIRGKFGNWALKRLCDKRKCKLSELQELFQSEDIAMDVYVDYLLAAVEYVARLERKDFLFIDVDSYDWIDQLGGFMSEDFISLMKHASEEDNKKKQDQTLIGTTMNDSAMRPV